MGDDHAAHDDGDLKLKALQICASGLMPSDRERALKVLALCELIVDRYHTRDVQELLRRHKDLKIG